MRPTSTALAATLVASALTGGVLLTAPSATASVPGVLSAAAPAAPAKPARFGDDFNGDGYRDLVIGNGDHGKDGRVTVVYGTASGPGTRTQVIHQDSPGIPGAVETGDMWGVASATADLDRDGYGDLIVSAPGEQVGRVKYRGGLTIIWGGKSGLGAGTTLHSTQTSGGPDQGDWFGETMATGDFDGDGDQDIVASSNSPAGALFLKGPFTRAGKYGGQQPLGGYGYLNVSELIAGNVDGKGGTDLYIVGYDLYQNIPAKQQPVFLHRGGASFADRPVHTLRVPDDGGGQLGPGLSVIGDFDKDGFGDLAIGRGLENTDRGRGSVIVHYGSADGRPKRTQTLSQDTAGVPGAAEDGDNFGSALDAGDVNGDGYADLAVGAFGEDAGKLRNTGMVTVLRGGPGGLTGKGATAFDQSTANVADTPEVDDAFGRTLKLADYTRDGRADLLVNVNEELGGKDRWGLVQILKGSPSGTTTSGAKHFTLDSLKLKYRTLGTYLTR